MTHLVLDLSKNIEDVQEQGSMRPRLSVWYDSEDEDSGFRLVTVSVGASWGAAQRFVSLTPGEARQLARMLVRTAEHADRVELENVA